MDDHTCPYRANFSIVLRDPSDIDIHQRFFGQRPWHKALTSATEKTTPLNSDP